jgi:hypothetical protein
MSDQLEIGATQINPESPVRLRECLTALAKHDDTHVLRFEVGLGASTRIDGEPAFSMTLTHSMGPEHELAIVPLLAKVFAHAMADFSERAAPRQGVSK